MVQLPKMTITQLLLITFLRTVLSVNILFISPLASPSHYIWNKALSLALIEHGHNITIVAHETDNQPLPMNYTLIRLEGLYEAIDKFLNYQDAMHDSPLVSMKKLYDYSKYSCQHDLNTEGLQTLLNYPKKFFDLIIFDITYNQCFYPLIKIFNSPPVIAVTAFLLPPHLGSSFGYHVHTSYTPYFSSGFTTDMSLKERLLNFIYTYVDIFYRNYIASRDEFYFAKLRFGDDIYKFEEVERNISLLLANIDPNLDNPIALPPNIIPVGGLHINPPQSLPNDIKKIADAAKNGFILFSLGTNIMFSMLNYEQQEALFTALKGLDQIIFWKSNIDNLTNIPENVIIKRWLPQNDMLDHPNIKLFISHGGGLSTQEAVYHGVPLVVIPFIIDQYINSRRIAKKKFGRALDHHNLTVENIYEAVKDVLENPLYRENIREVSKRFRNQPQKPLERAVFWIEFLLKYKTAEHLVTPARSMPFYISFNIDVFVVFLIIGSAVYKLAKLTLVYISNKFGHCKHIQKIKSM